MQAKNDFYGCAIADCGENAPSLGGKSRYLYLCLFDYEPRNDNEPIFVQNYVLADQYCTQCPVYKNSCKQKLCCTAFLKILCWKNSD